MAQQLEDHPGGIRSLSLLLKEHGGAINSDLLDRGWRRRDIGHHLSWGDFKDFIEGLPPTGDSALYRARNPQSWWVTPDIRFLAMAIHVLQLANWQRGGGKKAGAAPQPLKLPEDRRLEAKTVDELKSKRQAMAEHLRRARLDNKRVRRRQAIEEVNRFDR